MTKTKNEKVGLIVGLALIVLFALVILLETYIFFCVDIGISKHDTVVKYEDLQSITTDKMLYLSDDFMSEESLRIDPIVSSYQNKYVGDVILEYDSYKVSTGFNRYIIKTDLYRYEMVSADRLDIPIRVSIVGAIGINKNNNYDKLLANGDKYAVLDNELTNYFTGIGKSYEIKGKVGKSGAIDKYSRLKITVTVDAKEKNNYLLEDIENRIDKVLNSSLNYINRYNA